MKRLSSPDLFHCLFGIEPTRCSFCLKIIAMARPAIFLGYLHQSRLYCVQMNITHHGCQIFIGIDEDRLVAAPKQRPVAPMAPVESLGVDAIDMAHAPGEVSLGSSKTQMIMISHQ